MLFKFGLMKLFFRFSFILLFFVGAISITSCKEEDPLEPNPDAIGLQALDFNPFDSTGNGGGNGGGGGGNSVTEYFDATLDGNAVSYGTYTYQDNGISVIIQGSNNANMTAINFGLIDSVGTGETFDLGGSNNSGTYIRGVGDALISTSGQLVVDSLGANFIRGTFYFTAADVNNPSDSVVIENGSFQIGF